MSLPDPSVLADGLGLVAGTGPFTEQNWGEMDLRAAFNVNQKATDASPQESDRFYAHFNALYLPALVFAMNSFPLDGSEEGLWAVMVIFSTFQGCMVPKTSHCSPSFARFVRLETTRTLQLYTFLLRLIAYLSNVEFLTEVPTLLFVFNALVLLINTYHPSPVTLPAIEPSVKEDLVAVVEKIEKALRSASGPFEKHYKILYQILQPIVIDGARDLHAILAAQDGATVVRPWRTCELDRVGDEKIESCAQLEEGEEMRACSRCFAVRYCSREHQRLDWKRHKIVCFKPSW